MAAPPPRATSYDVARMAGVTQSTVSRCYQDDSRISPVTRQRVLEAASRIGYVPNALARSLITQRSNMVGVVVTRTTLRGNPDVLYAIGESLLAAGKQLLLVPVESDFPSLAALRGALEFPLDGLISCVLLADADLMELQRRRLPIVLYNRSPERIVCDSVTANHAAAAAELAIALHNAGHRRFLCIGGPSTAPVSRDRIRGFGLGLETLGITPTPAIETDFTYAGGRAAFLDHIRIKPRPDAVFCANDQIAMGVMDAARTDLGWSIPADLSVVGFDDVVEAARPTYELTTMRQDSVEMARQAVALLLMRLMSPQSDPVSGMVVARLMIRRSARLDRP